MLRVTVKDEMDGTRLLIEGRLTGEWADEAQHFWDSLLATRQIVAVVDVQGVMAIDAVGKALLQDIHRRGAQLLSRGCLMNSVVADIMRDSKRLDEGQGGRHHA
jgi:ABC-type transporter Mla MlaB component